MLRRLSTGGFRDCKQNADQTLSKMAAPCVESSSVEKNIYIYRDSVLVKLWLQAL